MDLVVEMLPVKERPAGERVREQLAERERQRLWVYLSPGERNGQPVEREREE
jgi:hypothetical protein